MLAAPEHCATAGAVGACPYLLTAFDAELVLCNAPHCLLSYDCSYFWMEPPLLLTVAEAAAAAAKMVQKCSEQFLLGLLGALADPVDEYNTTR